MNRDSWDMCICAGIAIEITVSFERGPPYIYAHAQNIAKARPNRKLASTELATKIAVCFLSVCCFFLLLIVFCFSD